MRYPLFDEVAAGIDIVRSPARSPPPVMGAVVEISLADGTLLLNTVQFADDRYPFADDVATGIASVISDVRLAPPVSGAVVLIVRAVGTAILLRHGDKREIL